jgi:hypothetical protein
LGHHFPQLEIIALLGHGGMGAVYKARQPKLDRLVALKIIRPEAAGDPAFAERFNREARMLARLSHPHIVAVYDFGSVDISLREMIPHAEREDYTQPCPLYYFLMEYVDGPNLRQLLQSGELLPQQALAIVPQICEALQFAHDEGVVHRDIKPENILLDKRGRVTIADFGLAKLAAGSTEDFTLTGTHQVMGTPRYMAPEQMEGSRAVDHRADIYSLGVVFYEMLTGEVPAGHFEPPSRKVEVDVRLDEVVLRALAREPERRYQQATEVKTDVEAISLSAAALCDTQSRRPDRGHVGRFLSNSTGWIILFCVIGACLSCLPWWHVTATGAGNVVYLVQPGYQEWVGRFAIGAFLGLGLLLIIDGVKVAPLPTWRPIVVVATATALLFVLGLNALGWRPGTIQVTEVSGDVGPLKDLADLAYEALASIARFVPGVGFYSALANAVALLVLGLGQLRGVLKAHRTAGAPVVESSRPDTSDEAAVVAGVKTSIPQASASQRSRRRPRR